MKKRKPVKPIVLKNEFRENKDIIPPHTAHVYAEHGNKYFSLAITHAPKTRRKRNIKMFKEPNPNADKSRDPYFVPTPRATHKKKMQPLKKDWKLDPRDDEQMAPYRVYEFDEKGKPKKKK